MKIPSSLDFSKPFSDHYEEVVVFENTATAIGCSVLLEYPVKGLLFYPAKNQLGEADSIILLKVFFDPRKVEGEKIELGVYVSKASRFMLRKDSFRYDDEQQESPSKEERIKSERTTQPMDLQSDRGECHYNIKTKTFYYNDEVVRPEKLVEIFRDKHLKTVKPIGGFIIRSKRRAVIGPKNFFKSCYKFCDWLIRELWGRVVSEKLSDQTVWIKFGQKNLKLEDMELRAKTTIELFGHSIVLAKPLLLISSILALVMFVTWSEFGWFGNVLAKYGQISTNPILLPAFLITYFWIIDVIFLRFIISLRNIAAKVMRYLEKTRVKV